MRVCLNVWKQMWKQLWHTNVTGSSQDAMLGRRVWQTQQPQTILKLAFIYRRAVLSTKYMLPETAAYLKPRATKVATIVTGKMDVVYITTHKDLHILLLLFKLCP